MDVIDITAESIIISDVTVFAGINIFDVVMMFIIFVDVVRVCIMTNNQLTKFSSQ